MIQVEQGLSSMLQLFLYIQSNSFIFVDYMYHGHGKTTIGRLKWVIKTVNT